ncbi:MAG: class I SAM-dependent methyltransferase [Armatimonadota bacterium]
MQANPQHELHNRAHSASFYDERYAQGYMEDWPPDKIARIIEVLRGANLPASGSALDFGCGNGVLTDIVRQALPGWHISGTDISEVAVQHARERYPQCTFFASNEENTGGQQFDLIFSNHVLEHVFDLGETLDEIDRYCKPTSTIIYVLPSGNAGSLEFNICQLHVDGVQTDAENRFFYEEPGHLRRLTSDRLIALYAPRGFSLSAEYYLNQYYGALYWIRQSGLACIRQLTATRSSRDKRATLLLLYYRCLFLLLLFANAVTGFTQQRFNKPEKSPRKIVLLLLLLPFYPLCKAIDRYIEIRARQEWRTRQTDRRGSEMSLVFKRQR